MQDPKFTIFIQLCLDGLTERTREDILCPHMGLVMVVRMEGLYSKVGSICSQLHGHVGLQLLHYHSVEPDGPILLADRWWLPGQCEGGRRLGGDCKVLRRTGWSYMDRN